MPHNADKYICKRCDFKCSKLSNYNTHIKSKKHNTTITTTIQPLHSQIYECICGKKYNHRASLFNHKKKCNSQSEQTSKEDSYQEQTSKEESQKEDKKDNVIDALIEDNKEMREMFIMFLKNQMESQVTQIENQNNTNKLITGLHENQADITTKIIREVLPLIGNDHHNTNSHNNTLNFYLTNTCKDAESITDFTSRFCERIETFFNGNYKQIAHNKVNLAENVQEIFFECMDDKTQINRFIQTTDTKNGIFYVKEQKKNEENKMVGDAEFVKYKDGFDKHGLKIGHAINKVLQPCKNACIPELEKNVIANPNEDTDDEEDNHYNRDSSEMKENLMFQTHNAMCIFDNKPVRDKALSETKRAKII
jgi:hypothetical protein